MKKYGNQSDFEQKYGNWNDSDGKNMITLLTLHGRNMVTGEFIWERMVSGMT